MTKPEVTVVVASHDRPLRLRWLLNALEEQTLAPERWQAVVVHDSRDDEAESVLQGHPLAQRGTLSHVRLPPGTGSPAVQRNIGWRAAGGDLIAFTDDDCRPAPTWLEELLSASREHPGAIVQGTTLPEPYEAELQRAPWHRTLEVHPPGEFAQTCNILYPRDLLDRVGGFDEGFPAPAGEDTDLAVRAGARGAPLVAGAAAVVYHAVEPYGLFGRLKLNWKWQHLAYLMKRHASVRRSLVLGVFWRRSHLLLLLALAGAASGRVTRLGPLAALPYLVHLLTWHRGSRRARARSVLEAPSRFTVELGEVAACARGSLRYRRLFL